jgi:hypothetical protein
MIELNVGAALAGLDLGELLTLPSLPDTSDRRAFDEARDALLPNRQSNAGPAVWCRQECRSQTLTRTETIVSSIPSSNRSAERRTHFHFIPASMRDRAKGGPP